MLPFKVTPPTNMAVKIGIRIINNHLTICRCWNEQMYGVNLIDALNIKYIKYNMLGGNSIVMWRVLL